MGVITQSSHRLDSRLQVLCGGVFLGAYFGAFALTARSIADHDCFVMAKVAEGVLHGKTLYVDAWDNKAPLAIMFYAIPQMVVRGSYLAIQLFLSLWLLLQAAVFFEFLRGTNVPSRCVGASLLLLLPLMRVEFSWASSEHTANLFVLIMILVSYRIAFLRRFSYGECLLAGVALALAFHTRQPTALFGVLPIAAVLSAGEVVPRKSRALAAMAAGAILGAGGILLLVLACGDLQGYFYTVFVAPSRYPKGFREAAKLVWKFRTDAVLLLILASGLLVLRHRHWHFAALLVAVTLLVVVSPLRPYTHYWAQVIPTMAVLAFMALAGLRSWHAGLAPILGRRGPYLALAVMLFISLNALLTVTWLAVQRPSLKDYDAVAAELETLAQSNDTLFAVGENEAYLYFAVRVPPANVYFWPLYLQRDWSMVLPKRVEVVLAEYRSQPPTLLVIQKAVLDGALLRSAWRKGQG